MDHAVDQALASGIAAVRAASQRWTAAGQQEHKKIC
jgi:hypothetical protein